MGSKGDRVDDRKRSNGAALSPRTIARRGQRDARRDLRDARNGAGYDAFRTGLDFATVRQFLWAGDDDPKTWRYKRRGTVLGTWREMKLQLWHQKLDAEEAAE